jgi:hypothetical protein
VRAKTGKEIRRSANLVRLVFLGVAMLFAKSWERHLGARALPIGDDVDDDKSDGEFSVKFWIMVVVILLLAVRGLVAFSYDIIKIVGVKSSGNDKGLVKVTKAGDDPNHEEAASASDLQAIEGAETLMARRSCTLRGRRLPVVVRVTQTGSHFHSLRCKDAVKPGCRELTPCLKCAEFHKFFEASVGDADGDDDDRGKSWPIRSAESLG